MSAAHLASIAVMRLLTGDAPIEGLVAIGVPCWNDIPLRDKLLPVGLPGDSMSIGADESSAMLGSGATPSRKTTETVGSIVHRTKAASHSR